MRRLIAAFALALAFAGGAPAFAQIARQDADAPLEVRGDMMEALPNDGRYIYTKNVDAVQGNARLRSDKLTLICAKKEPAPKPAPGQPASTTSCDAQTLIADGSVYYLTPDGKMTGDHAEYDYVNKIITVTGKVILARDDGSVVNGCRLVYDLNASRVTITNNCSAQGSGQVFSVFIPQPKKTPAPAATTPAPPAPAASPTPSAPAPAGPGASH